MPGQSQPSLEDSSCVVMAIFHEIGQLSNIETAIYIYTSVDPNAYTCIHTKLTRSKELTQQSKTGQHAWLPICHNFVPILSKLWSPLRSSRRLFMEDVRTCEYAVVLRQCLVVGKVSLTFLNLVCICWGPAWAPLWPAWVPVWAA